MNTAAQKLALAASLLLASAGARADEVQVAVAANFAGPMQKIAAAFEQSTGHKVLQTSGSTGKFYAQIKAGAPFEVLFAADDETPAKLEAEGAGVPGSRFTYAVGKLVLWSSKADRVDSKGEVLKKGDFAHLAVANPKLAPYGQAAMETIKALGLTDALTPKFVVGENIAQTHQFVATGNAELGFVALSQVQEGGSFKSGSGWIVPASMHAPIRQDMILLEKGKGKPAAEALMKFMKTDAAKAVITAAGYSL
ncbi:molybdate ABC transporter substrate-binding protein [Pseudoduganella sp. UC29_106]|uniref:molybdate ABC transporter substrate-binding protein n=1 Tax=Pseudoduganella sp. UC29_106 TaxID=3374553 RepID=UPI003757881C